jgi:pyruvate dehydrogenase E2 component (dihydrolipoamide acetyltransferase)
MSDFTMPSLGADMESATLTQWLVKPGDAVRSGDVIAVVETQKGAIEVEIFMKGTVAELVAAPGTSVPVGGLLARIETAGPIAAPIAGPSAGVPAPPVAAQAIPPPPPVAAPEPLPPRGTIAVSPAARRRAAELGIDPASLTGTGLGGAISYADVELAHRAGAAPAPAPRPARPGAFDPLAMRRAIAAAMTRSKREIPHYYLSTTIDMAPARDWLAAYNAPRPPGERILAAVLLLKAAAVALRKVPGLNGFWRNGRFEPGEGVHIGWAIALRGGGLIAPALHHADHLAVPDVMARLRDLVARARSGGLRSSELSDATATITSLGERGADGVIGVIHPPQVAILGFGRVQERPWVVAGAVVPRPLIDVSLAADHRASDGHAGGLLLAAIEAALQEPDTL